MPPLTRPRLRRGAPVLLGLLALAAGSRCTAPPPALPARPNIVLVVIDTLRADRLGCYGNPRDTSPFLDRTAARGIRFPRAYAQAGWTMPSVMSVLTSLYPSVHGIQPQELAPEMPSLSPQITTVAEVLQQHGYRTGAFFTLPYTIRWWGFDRGFTHYAEGIDADLRPLRLTAAENVQRATDWLAQSPEPFLCLLHFFDVHYPYRVEGPDGDRYLPADYAGPLSGTEPFQTYLERARAGALSPADVAFSLAGYDGALRSVDTALARFWERVRALGLEDRTLLIVTSDHGEEFLEHGGVAHGELSLFEEVLRVPLIVSGPGLDPGRTENAVVELIDLAPTMLEYAGIAPAYPFQGQSLLPLLRDPAAPAGPPTALAEGRTDTLRGEAFVQDDWKLLCRHGESTRCQLFHLTTDPGETRNATETHPADYDRVNAGRRAALAANDQRRVHPPRVVAVDAHRLEETLKQFRAHGYLQ